MTGVDNFIGVADTFDVTAKPTIADGTTTALIEYRTRHVPSVTDWTPSGERPESGVLEYVGHQHEQRAGCVRFAGHTGEHVRRCDDGQRDDEEEGNIRQRLRGSHATDERDR